MSASRMSVSGAGTLAFGARTPGALRTPGAVRVSGAETLAFAVSLILSVTAGEGTEPA